MAISHAGHDHPATPAGRARCRRGQSTPSSKGATPRTLNLDKKDEEKHPAERSRCCYNCKLRQIEWFGTTRIHEMSIYVCDKCKYMLDPAKPIKAMEV